MKAQEGMFVDLVLQKILCGGTGKRSSASYMRMQFNVKVYVHIEKNHTTPRSV
jgi:hypothetical protein